MGYIVKIISYIIFFALILWVLGQLFLKEPVDRLAYWAWDKLKPGEEEVVLPKIEDLRILYPEEFHTLEPTNFEPIVRQRTLNVYEPLLKLDRNMKPTPSLALNWGLVDEVNWEFHLRPDVIFHDGSVFDANDVVSSFKRAKFYEKSQMKDLLSSIDNVQVVNDLEVLITTFEPDPLLLQKVASLLIIPNELETDDLINPVGTGSYKFTSWDGKILNVERFKEYWGDLAEYYTVQVLVEKDLEKRLNLFLEGEVDFLAFVPQAAAPVIEQYNHKIEFIPSLEVEFLLFNFDSPIFRNTGARRAITQTISTPNLLKILGEYVREVNQFVSNGVFGYNQNIVKTEINKSEASSYLRDSGLTGKTVELNLPKGLEILGEHIIQELEKVGLLVSINHLDAREYESVLSKNEGDLSFLAFKSILGDSVEFFETVIHSKGESNFANYQNDKVDKLIEDSLVNMDFEQRLRNLHEIMRIIVEEDFVGIPLFESETIYAFIQNLKYEPRIDGMIYFDEITYSP